MAESADTTWVYGQCTLLKWGNYYWRTGFPNGNPHQNCVAFVNGAFLPVCINDIAVYCADNQWMIAGALNIDNGDAASFVAMLGNAVVCAPIGGADATGKPWCTDPNVWICDGHFDTWGYGWGNEFQIKFSIEPFECQTELIAPTPSPHAPPAPTWPPPTHVPTDPPTNTPPTFPALPACDACPNIPTPRIAIVTVSGVTTCACLDFALPGLFRKWIQSPSIGPNFTLMLMYRGETGGTCLWDICIPVSGTLARMDFYLWNSNGEYKWTDGNYHAPDWDQGEDPDPVYFPDYGLGGDHAQQTGCDGEGDPSAYTHLACLYVFLKISASNVGVGAHYITTDLCTEVPGLHWGIPIYERSIAANTICFPKTLAGNDNDNTYTPCTDNPSPCVDCVPFYGGSAAIGTG
jgi:hypothetical protein